MKYDPEVARAIAYWSPRLGVAIEPALVHAVIEKESTHGVALESAEPGGHKSYGPMMVLDTTARAFGVSNPATLKDPALGIWYGVRALGEELARFPGDVARAISAYNTGAARAAAAVGKFPNQSYVDAVLGFWRRYRSAVLAAAPAVGVLALMALLLFLVSRRRARA